jgi:3-oxoacyl-[acyl-carrier protein] reductase
MLETGLGGRVCLVTGAASGIGLACAELLGGEGARLVLADRDGDGLAGAEPPGAADLLHVPCDVSDAREVDALMAAIRERHGHLDVLVHCAGIYTTSYWKDVDEDEWHRVMDVNLHGSFLVAQGAMALMEGAEDGRIVLFGSYAARTGGLRASAAYAAAKAGVGGLMRHLALHGGPLGIRVNCVHPGMIDTPMTDVLSDQARADGIGRVPLGRSADPDEAAAMAVVLASDLSSFVHGVQLDVNGGMYMA